MKKKLSPISVLLVLVALSVGLFFGRYAFSLPQSQTQKPSSPLSDKTYEQGYADALDETRNKLSSKDPVFDLLAVLDKVEGKTLTIQFDSAKIDALAEGSMTRQVIVSDSTQILRRIPLTREQILQSESDFEKAMEQYRKLAANRPQDSDSAPSGQDPEAPMPPSGSVIEYLKADSLKPGDMLLVTTKEDLRTNETANAERIEFVGSAVPDFSSLSEASPSAESSPSPNK